MITLNRDTFVVFDLDDTLYPEDLYHTSGLRTVAGFVEQLYGVPVLETLLTWKASGVHDLWGRLCELLNLEKTAKESFAWLYRLHKPDISLPEDIARVVASLARSTAGLAILTDGRSVTQRLKIKALNLSAYPLYISEEWQSEKPDPKRFLAIAAHHKAGRYAYIADNPAKDFLTPNELGWITVGIRGGPGNIHSQSVEHLPPHFHPQVWLPDILTLREFIC